jgi:hypothetical protein
MLRQTIRSLIRCTFQVEIQRDRTYLDGLCFLVLWPATEQYKTRHRALTRPRYAIGILGLPLHLEASQGPRILYRCCRLTLLLLDRSGKAAVGRPASCKAVKTYWDIKSLTVWRVHSAFPIYDSSQFFEIRAIETAYFFRTWQFGCALQLFPITDQILLNSRVPRRHDVLAR